jgi:hypothetical protein
MKYPHWLYRDFTATDYFPLLDSSFFFLLGMVAGALWFSLPVLDFMNDHVVPLLDWANLNGFRGFGLP